MPDDDVFLGRVTDSLTWGLPHDAVLPDYPVIDFTFQREGAGRTWTVRIPVWMLQAAARGDLAREVVCLY